MTCLPSPRPRAGVLRRGAAFLVDILFFTGVLSIVGPLAFTLSDGRVQMDGLLPVFSDCGRPIPIPSEINPKPVLGDAAVACSAGPLPFVVSQRSLTVSVTTLRGPEGRSTTFASYPLSTSGAPISAFDASWLGRLGLVAYLTISLAARGRTFGMRLMGIRLSVESGTEPGRGVPALLVFVRTCAAVAGLLIPGLGFVLAFGMRDGSAASMALFIGIVGPIAWTLVNTVTIANGRDPIYDRLAGLTVSVVQGRPSS